MEVKNAAGFCIITATPAPLLSTSGPINKAITLTPGPPTDPVVPPDHNLPVADSDTCSEVDSEITAVANITYSHRFIQENRKKTAQQQKFPKNYMA